jgi:hypothetical protein
MRARELVLTGVLVLFLAAGASAQNYELRTWATPGAAPADGGPTSSSANFVLRSRLGGPFAGHAESTSFALWGCSAYTAVEAAFFATIDPDDAGRVVLRWTVESTAGIRGFNVRRSSAESGPFETLNAEMLPVTAQEYADSTVWPGTSFWYQLWVVLPDGSEEQALHAPVVVTTGGTLSTRLFAIAPNPFTSETVIHHDVASVVGGAKLTIYDVAGRVVRRIDLPCERPGRYSATWNGRNDRGQEVASGVYFCSLEAGGERDTRPVVLLR